MALLTREDLRRQSPLAWVCLLLLAALAAWFWTLDKRNASAGTMVALVGCLGIILPPRERMPVLPHRLRALPRGLDAAPILATILSSPGYGLNWFYGENPYDEAVHLLSGALAGAVLAGMILADGRRRTAGRLLLLTAGIGLALGVTWEVFEWSAGIVGDWTDTWTDVVLTTAGAAAGGTLYGRRA